MGLTFIYDTKNFPPLPSMGVSYLVYRGNLLHPNPSAAEKHTVDLPGTTKFGTATRTATIVWTDAICYSKLSIFLSRSINYVSTVMIVPKWVDPAFLC